MTDKWTLDVTPLPVQEEALKQSGNLRGYAYFMEPGMGKTGTILSEFSYAESRGAVDLLVVVCPNNLRANWRYEAEKMGFGYDVAIYPEPAPEKGMWVFNYEKIISNPFDELVKVMKKRNVFMVCDESHRIKNFKAKVSKAAIFLFDMAKVKRVMTGTPIANNVVDLWSQLRAIGAHGSHRSPYTFRNRYGVMGGWMGKQIVGTQREEELREILAQCAFRAKKKDWMSTLPPKVYYSLGYEMTPRQQELYEQIKRDRLVFLEDGSEVSAQLVVTALMKMQQITSGFMMDDEGNVARLCGNHNPKLDAVQEQVDEVEGKVILFAHYRHTIDELESRLHKKNPLVIRGGMKKEDVMAVVASFNGDDDRTLLIAQTSTAKEGLTLLGTNDVPCHTTIFVENTYSIIDRTQAEDRNHRHGQNAEQVSYYDLVGSPIEHKIILALQNKKDLIKTVMENRNV